MTVKLESIDRVIKQTTDRKLLRLLNRAWWREYFAHMNVYETTTRR